MGFEKEPSQIKFSSYLKPALPVGEYEITLTQKLSKVQHAVEEELLKTETVKKFFVAGERFRINPGEISGVFPPTYSLGEHSRVLPHVMINRSTLPWERRTAINDDTTPWLGLVVIYENEEANVTSKPAKLGDVKTQLKIADAPEPAQADTDTVQILRIKKDLLEKILPTKKDLRSLTHIRQVVGNAHKTDHAEIAVLIANRLPLKGGASTVYLVSLENRYEDGDDGVFDFGKENTDEWISLIQLHSWSFTCRDSAIGDFANIIKNLKRSPSTLRLPDSKLPSNNQNLKYLQQGFYPLPHKLRAGSQTVSWYHGPLAPAPTKPLLTAPVTCADSLLHYYQDNGMFDVSYAAAWELGRLLALQNAHFSTELYKWKKQYGRSIYKAEQMKDVSHLPGANRDHSPAPVPDSVDRWLKDLVLLKGVPFNYLVPDEELLPAGSIRFFRLDKGWVQALLDGALSIGRVTKKDQELDKEMIAEVNLLANKDVTGFILRSELVSGWPGMDVEGFKIVFPKDVVPDEKDKLVILRNETLSANVRLCLFEGELKTLSLHLKPEMLHFGLDEETGKGYSKKWRDEKGNEDDTMVITVPIDKAGVLHVSSLLKSYTDSSKTISSSAHLAVQLLEGVECVRFQV